MYAIVAVGGSSYIGGCSANSPIIYYPGVTGTTNTVTLPGGATANGYTTGVGVGSISTVGTVQSTGGNGAIIVTVVTIPTVAPSSAPTSSAPTSGPTASPTIFPSTTAPSFSPSVLSSSVVIPNLPRLPTCPEGWTLHSTCEWTYGGKHLYQEASPAPVSDNSYQLIIVSGSAGILIGMMLMGLYTAFCILPSKDNVRRTEYIPIN